MNDLSIRQATLSDLLLIQNFNRELCAKENREYDATINPEYPFTKEGEEYFKSRIESEDALVIIAELEGKAVGYLVGSIVPSEDYRNISQMAEAENMFVDEAFRGKKIGGTLIENFEDWCQKKGVQKIRYVVSAENNKALAFYKAHGCKEINITLEKNLNE